MSAAVCQQVWPLNPDCHSPAPPLLAYCALSTLRPSPPSTSNPQLIMLQRVMPSLYVQVCTPQTVVNQVCSPPFGVFLCPAQHAVHDPMQRTTPCERSWDICRRTSRWCFQAYGSLKSVNWHGSAAGGVRNPSPSCSCSAAGAPPSSTA